MVALAVFCFAITTGTLLAGTEQPSESDRFRPGRVFFQHASGSQDDYIRKLQAAIVDRSLASTARAIARCELAFLTEDPVSARRAVELEMLNHEAPEISNIACRCAMRCGDSSRGEQICKSVLAAHPDNTDAHLLWAMISKTITPELEEIVQVDSYAWIVKAQFYGTREEFPACFECAERYLKEHDSGPFLQAHLPHELLGISLFKMGHRSLQTANALERGFQLMGEFKEVRQKQKAATLAAMIASCYVDEKKLERAYEWAKTGYALDSELYDTNLLVGLLTIELRENAGAFTEIDRQGVECLKKAISLKPSENISVKLSGFLINKGQIEEGCLIYARLLPTAMEIDASTLVSLVGALLSTQNEKSVTKSQLDYSKTTLLNLLPRVSEIEPKNRRMYVACLTLVDCLEEATTVIAQLKKLKQDKLLAADIVYLERLLEFVKSKGAGKAPE